MQSFYRQDTLGGSPIPPVKQESVGQNEHMLAGRDSVHADSLHPAEQLNRLNFAQHSTHKREGRWQLMAMGTLGSSLSQNVPSSIPGIASVAPAPDGPGHNDPHRFSTWEEFFEHLNNVPPGEIISNQQPLLDIASNNRGAIEEHERHDRPLTFGFSLRRTLQGRWGLETGLQYSLLRSDFTQGSGSYYIGRQQRIHYLGVPLRATYCVATTRRLQAYVSAGVQMNIPLQGSLATRYVTGTQVQDGGRETFLPPLQWQVSAGAGLQYSLSPHWAVYAEPSWLWNVPGTGSVHTVWTEHPFSFSMPVGLRYSW